MFDEDMEFYSAPVEYYSGKDRLIRLAHKLEGTGPYEKIGPVKQFDLRDWYRGNIDVFLGDHLNVKWENPDCRNDIQRIVRNMSGESFSQLITQGFASQECGFAACAAGWAALDPWFNKQGLRTIYMNMCFGQLVILYEEPNSRDVYHSDTALSNFFEISKQDVNYLFIPDYYNRVLPSEITPAMVAKRIWEIVLDK